MNSPNPRRKNMIEISSKRDAAMAPAISKRLALAWVAPALALSGCYVMPVGTAPDGNPYYVYSPVPVVPGPRATPGAPVVGPTGPMPAVLNVKLYPSNDLANQTGVLSFRCKMAMHK